MDVWRPNVDPVKGLMSEHVLILSWNIVIAYKMWLSLYFLLSSWTSLLLRDNTKSSFSLWVFRLRGSVELVTTPWISESYCSSPTSTLPHVCLTGLSFSYTFIAFINLVPPQDVSSAAFSDSCGWTCPVSALSHPLGAKLENGSHALNALSPLHVLSK